MSSVVPKKARVWGGKRPASFNDIDRRVQHIAKIVSVITGPCRIVGSYAESLPAIDSDIDIGLNAVEDIIKYKKQVNEISNIFGVKIDLCTIEGGIDVKL